MEPVSAIKSQRAETSPAPRALRIGFVPEGVCAFVGTGVEWLVEHRPALAENPALHELRALVQVPVGDGDADGGSESQ
jgi:hypothetical protein